LRNALIPVVTVYGLQFGGLVVFATITETIFAWPGMGKLLIDSINISDRPVIIAYLLMGSFLFVVINFVVDVLYTIIDPRIDLR
jgi:peptide/nickel transport system permease protein